MLVLRAVQLGADSVAGYIFWHEIATSTVIPNLIVFLMGFQIQFFLVLGAGM